MPDPKNFAAYPVSDSQAILIWDKPTGIDYAFLLMYKVNTQIRYKTMQGLQGFGTMDMAVLSELKPKTEYYAQVEFYCAGAPYIRSKVIPIRFTTLAKGLFMFLCKPFRILKSLSLPYYSNLDTFKNTPCGNPVIAPVNVSAQPSGVNHVTLRWFKPIPEDYNYAVRYHSTTAPTKDITSEGATKFGPLFSYQAYHLNPQTTYNFFVKHTCKTQSSAEKPANAKTFGQCKLTF